MRGDGDLVSGWIMAIIFLVSLALVMLILPLIAELLS